MKNTDNTSLLFDLSIFSSEKTALLSELEKWLQQAAGLKVIYTPNPEQIVQTRGNSSFQAALKKADLLLPDGVGLVMAAKFLSLFGKAKPLSERIAGVEVVADLLEIALRQQLEVLVIGGRGYSPRDYFAYKGAKINWLPGFEDIQHPTRGEKSKLNKKIAKLKPDLVFVALGAPDQELWIEENRDLLSKNKVRLAMAVGGSFDYLLGKVPRAPYWFRKLGLEWLFRLIMEPWRFKRQLRLVTFMNLTIRKAFKN